MRKFHRRSAATWGAGLALAGLGLAAGRVVRQERIQRELVAAVAQGDEGTAVHLLEAGADPNASASSGPNTSWLRRFWDSVRHRPPPAPTGDPVLVMAVQSHEARVAAALLAHGADCNRPAADGKTPLMFAVFDQNLGLAAALLARHADPNAVRPAAPDAPSGTTGALFYSGCGLTPLSIAVYQNSLPMARLLLDHGAKPDFAAPHCDPPIFGLAGDPHPEPMLDLLHSYGADWNRLSTDGDTYLMRVFDALHDPAQDHPPSDAMVVKTMDSLFRRGFRVPKAALGRFVRFVDLNSDQPYAPLLVVDDLLRHGADPNGTGPNGQTLLMGAALNDRPLMKRLLAAHADPNRQDQWGCTALMNASYTLQGGEGQAEATRPENVRFLLAHGAHVDERDPSGRTALARLAAASLDPEAAPTVSVAALCRSAEALIAGGADVNARDGQGQTPLIALVARRRGDSSPQRLLPLARLLRTHGADPAIRDGQGRTAQDWARPLGCAPLTAVLSPARVSPASSRRTSARAGGR